MKERSRKGKARASRRWGRGKGKVYGGRVGKVGGGGGRQGGGGAGGGGGKGGE